MLHRGNSIIDTYCKYAIAHCIVEEFRSNLVNKKMLIWHAKSEDETLLDCTHDKCKGEDNVCCRKRKIKLALIEKMSAWLQDKDNLRYLQDGEACNCAKEYTQEQLDYHDDFLNRLVETGKINFSRYNNATDETECDSSCGLSHLVQLNAACDSSQDSESSEEETDSSLWSSWTAETEF